MKKSLLVFLVLSMMLLANPFSTFANESNGNELQFDLLDIYEEGNDIKVE